MIKRLLSYFAFYLKCHWIIKLVTAKKPYLAVLNYHTFNKFYLDQSSGYFETIQNEQFKKQLRFLKRNFNVISVEEFYSGKGKKGLNIAITFDDGYRDNHSHALPALKEIGFDSCIFFVTTGYINSNRFLWHDSARIAVSLGIESSNRVENALLNVNNDVKFDFEYFDSIENALSSYSLTPLMMTWTQIVEIYGEGYIIGAHTVNHIPLNFANNDEKRVEITSSVSCVNKKLNIQSTHFAYPNGSFCEETISILKDVGIQYAYTTKQVLNTKDTCKFKINRLGVNPFDSIGLLILKLILAMVKTK